MTKRRKFWITVTAASTLVVAAALGAAGAIAASDAPSPKHEEQAVLADAAERLRVTPGELSDALKKALASRVDAAVEAGRLTGAQGDELKARIESGRLPLLLGGLARGPMHAEHLGHPGGLDAAAAYLGLDEVELRARLADGKTLAQVAKAEGKSVDGLVAALVADAKDRLAEAVADGRLTQEQADTMADRLERRITDLVDGDLPERGFRRPFRDGHPHRGLGFGLHGPHS